MRAPMQTTHGTISSIADARIVDGRPALLARTDRGVLCRLVADVDRLRVWPCDDTGTRTLRPWPEDTPVILDPDVVLERFPTPERFAPFLLALAHGVPAAPWYGVPDLPEADGDLILRTAYTDGYAAQPDVLANGRVCFGNPEQMVRIATITLANAHCGGFAPDAATRALFDIMALLDPRAYDPRSVHQQCPEDERRLWVYKGTNDLAPTTSAHDRARARIASHAAQTAYDEAGFAGIRPAHLALLTAFATTDAEPRLANNANTPGCLLLPHVPWWEGARVPHFLADDLKAAGWVERDDEGYRPTEAGAALGTRGAQFFRRRRTLARLRDWHRR